MKRIVLRYGLASGVVLELMSAIWLWIPLSRKGSLNFEHGELIGYTSMVLAFLMVFFGIRSYRSSVAGGTISFGKAFQVGILITLITCAIYVISWEIAYFNFFPDFLDHYNAHALAKMRASGATEAALQEAAGKMAEMAKSYKNPLFNSAITFLEIFPVGLIMTLISAAILRRKPPQGAPASAVPA
jgi:hypothetical protein